jgi:hypothetical protein
MAIGIFSRINNAIKALQGGTVPKLIKRGYLSIMGDNAISKGRAREETHGQLFSREGKQIARFAVTLRKTQTLRRVVSISRLTRL